jgi:hypothetical protein
MNQGYKFRFMRRMDTEVKMSDAITKIQG